MINNGAIISLTERISMIVKETTEYFILETIEPYCSEVAEIKISKEELKRIILKNYGKSKTVIGNDVLDKIRAEIEQERVGYPPSAGYYKAIMKCLQIIDKYREREDKD